jgi:hypothetical protein
MKFYVVPSDDIAINARNCPDVSVLGNNKANSIRGDCAVTHHGAMARTELRILKRPQRIGGDPCRIRNTSQKYLKL